MLPVNMKMDSSRNAWFLKKFYVDIFFYRILKNVIKECFNYANIFIQVGCVVYLKRENVCIVQECVLHERMRVVKQ